MKIVKIAIQFILPCLGNIDRDGKILAFRKDAEGRALFMESWWHSALKRAAMAYGKHQDEVMKVKIDPVIMGEIKTYRRYYKRTKYRKHEAFLGGDIVTRKYSARRFRADT